MKNIRKLWFILAIFILGAAFDSSAQVYIKVRPARPHYERRAAPGPRHIWVEEDWEPRGGTYVFVGGRWVEPPRPRAVWIAGHWVHRPRGWVWIRGHWR